MILCLYYNFKKVLRKLTDLSCSEDTGTIETGGEHTAGTAKL